MKDIPDELTDPELIELLDSLRQVPPRQHSAMVRGRAAFLSEASDLASSPLQPSSKSFLSALQAWLGRNLLVSRAGQPGSAFVARFAAALLVIALFFGGAAVAVRAAEGSLPGQAMWPLKIALEDAREAAAGHTLRVQLSIQQVEIRIHEALQLRAQGQAVPEEAFGQLDYQLEQTLLYLTSLADEELVPLLPQVRARFAAQEALVISLQEQGAQDAVLDRIRAMLQDRLGVIGDGTQDPQKFKVEVRDRDRGSWTDDNPPVNGGGDDAAPGPGAPSATCTPQAGAGSETGPATASKTPGPGSGSGSGAGAPSATCTPLQEGAGPKPPGETPLPGTLGPGPGSTAASGVNPGAGEPTASPTQYQSGTSTSPGSGEPTRTPAPGTGSGSGGPTGTPTQYQSGASTGPGPGAGETPTPGGTGSGAGKP